MRYEIAKTECRVADRGEINLIEEVSRFYAGNAAIRRIEQKPVETGREDPDLDDMQGDECEHHQQ